MHRSQAAASAWLVKWLVLRPYKMRIAGTVTFVNGATTTLGAELCRAAWREGASLFMVSKNKAALHELHRELSKTGQPPRILARSICPPQCSVSC